MSMTCQTRKKMMRKIEHLYLNRAKEIHTQFLGLSKELEKEESRLEKVKESLKKVVEDLQQTNERLTKSRDKNDAQPIYNILKDLELQYQKVENILKPIMGKIEALRKEEHVLFDVIKRTYPELLPDDIKKQVQEYVFV